MPSGWQTAGLEPEPVAAPADQGRAAGVRRHRELDGGMGGFARQSGDQLEPGAAPQRLADRVTFRPADAARRPDPAPPDGPGSGDLPAAERGGDGQLVGGRGQQRPVARGRSRAAMGTAALPELPARVRGGPREAGPRRLRAAPRRAGRVRCRDGPSRHRSCARADPRSSRGSSSSSRRAGRAPAGSGRSRPGSPGAAAHRASGSTGRGGSRSALRARPRDRPAPELSVRPTRSTLFERARGSGTTPAGRRPRQSGPRIANAPAAGPVTLLATEAARSRSIPSASNAKYRLPMSRWLRMTGSAARSSQATEYGVSLFGCAPAVSLGIRGAAHVPEPVQRRVRHVCRIERHVGPQIAQGGQREPGEPRGVGAPALVEGIGLAQVEPGPDVGE